jgi:2'-5' RNA ligase
MGRYFIAISPSGLTSQPELKKLIGKMKRTLSERDKVVRWVPPSDWHVTLQFLGDLDGARVDRVSALLEAWRPAPVEIRLHGFGAFPTQDQARVLWIGIQQNQKFLDLQADLARRLSAEGFPPDEREFRPHLTVARLRNPQAVGDLVALGGRKNFGSYEVNEVILFESVLQAKMPKYIPVFRHHLT